MRVNMASRINDCIRHGSNDCICHRYVRGHAQAPQARNSSTSSTSVLAGPIWALKWWWKLWSLTPTMTWMSGANMCMRIHKHGRKCAHKHTNAKNIWAHAHFLSLLSLSHTFFNHSPSSEIQSSDIGVNRSTCIHTSGAALPLSWAHQPVTQMWPSLLCLRVTVSICSAREAHACVRDGCMQCIREAHICVRHGCMQCMRDRYMLYLTDHSACCAHARTACAVTQMVFPGRFVSNVDGAHMAQLLKGVDPETALFIGEKCAYFMCM